MSTAERRAQAPLAEQPPAAAMRPLAGGILRAAIPLGGLLSGLALAAALLPGPDAPEGMILALAGAAPALPLFGALLALALGGPGLRGLSPRRRRSASTLCWAATGLGIVVLALRGGAEATLLGFALLGAVLGLLPLLRRPRLLRHGRPRQPEAVPGDREAARGAFLLIGNLVLLLLLLAMAWTPEVVLWAAMIAAPVMLMGLAALAGWSSLLPPAAAGRRDTP